MMKVGLNKIPLLLPHFVNYCQMWRNRIQLKMFRHTYWCCGTWETVYYISFWIVLSNSIVLVFGVGQELSRFKLWQEETPFFVCTDISQEHH